MFTQPLGWFKKPVTGPADFKGLKYRTVGLSVDVFKELGAAVVSELKGKPGLSLVGKTTLRDLIGIFAECAVAFGPDSGPMHIAAAVGCPIVSLWGATAPERSAMHP